MRNILIVADPHELCNTAGDTSLAIAEGAIQSGFAVFWTTENHISLVQGRISLSHCQQIQPDLSAVTVAISPLEFAFIFVRKDPPMDTGYRDLCWLLSTQSNVINTSAALLSHHEKLLPAKLCAMGILPQTALPETLISKQIHLITAFPKSTLQMNFPVITKPWLGHGGRGVEKHDNETDFTSYLKGLPMQTPTELDEHLIVQQYLPAIHTRGDRRILAVRGRIFCHFTRYPPQGEITANLVRGGTASLLEISDTELEIATNVAKSIWESFGIVLAGIDMIGDKVTEVNITSPTGIRAYETLTQRSCSQEFFRQLVEE